MILLASAILVSDLIKPPKQPDLKFEWRVQQVRGIDEIRIRPIYFRDWPRWVRLYGIEVPKAGQTGYSGSEQFLEILLGRAADIFFEDEDPKHPLMRNAEYVQYLWTRGKLIQFEMLHEGWAKLTEEGRSGKYGKVLAQAEDEAKHLKWGIWANLK